MGCTMGLWIVAQNPGMIRFFARQSFDLLEIQPGQLVFDADSDPGGDVRALAERTGANSHEIARSQLRERHRDRASEGSVVPEMT